VEATPRAAPPLRSSSSRSGGPWQWCRAAAPNARGGASNVALAASKPGEAGGKPLKKRKTKGLLNYFYFWTYDFNWF